MNTGQNTTIRLCLLRGPGGHGRRKKLGWGRSAGAEFQIREGSELAESREESTRRQAGQGRGVRACVQNEAGPPSALLPREIVAAQSPREDKGAM